MGPAENRAFSRGPRFFGPIKWHEVDFIKLRQVYSTGALIVIMTLSLVPSVGRDQRVIVGRDQLTGKKDS